MCEWGYGRCTAPDTECPHWIGCICELDAAFYNYENVIEEKGFKNDPRYFDVKFDLDEAPTIVPAEGGTDK